MMSLVKATPSQEDAATIDEETMALRSALRGGPEVFLQEKSKWSYYHKPITLIVIGGTVFLWGIIHTVLYFTKYVKVPYVLGPVFLSIGLMFLVTGLVWFFIVKQAVRRKGILRKIYASRIATT